MRFCNALHESEAEAGGVNIDFFRESLSYSTFGKELRLHFIGETNAGVRNRNKILPSLFSRPIFNPPFGVYLIELSIKFLTA